MCSRGYFILGTKLLGVWCTFMSIIHIGAAITTFVDFPNMGDEYASIMFLSRIVMRVIPIIYFSLGIYLIKNGTALHNFAYPPQADPNGKFEIREKFVLFLKLLGVYLMVSYFPDLLKSITSYLTYSNTSAIYDLSAERQNAYINFLPSLAGILLGFYLLKSGNFFIRFGFESGNFFKGAVKENLEKK